MRKPGEPMSEEERAIHRAAYAERMKDPVYRAARQRWSKKQNDKRKGDPVIRERNRIASKEWHKKNYVWNPTQAERDGFNQKQREWRLRLKHTVFAAYGDKCVCCGEARFEFLTIDHTNGGGTRHRKQLKADGVHIYQLLKRKGYPKEDYRLLCFNCNCSKGFSGFCPHEKETLAMRDWSLISESCG